jgi:hypothetical protein
MSPQNITKILRLIGWLFLFGLTFFGILSLFTLGDMMTLGDSLGSFGTAYLLITLTSGIGTIVAGVFMWALCHVLAIITEALLYGLDILEERLPTRPPSRIRKVVRRQ